MTDPDRLNEIRNAARRVAETAHDDLGAATIDTLAEFTEEVKADLEGDDRGEAGEKLLAFWESFVERKLEAAGKEASDIAEETLGRFEQAFDEEVIGVDLYQALETLAIVDDMPPDDTDEDRLAQWAGRVHALTDEFVTHLRGHQDG